MIILNKDYRVDADKLQFIIQRRKINNDETSENYGKETWINEAYVNSPEKVLRYILENTVKENIDSSIYQIIQEIKKIESMFSELLKLKLN